MGVTKYHVDLVNTRVPKIQEEHHLNRLLDSVFNQPDLRIYVVMEAEMGLETINIPYPILRRVTKYFNPFKFIQIHFFCHHNMIFMIPNELKYCTRYEPDLPSIELLGTTIIIHKNNEIGNPNPFLKFGFFFLFEIGCHCFSML